MRSLLKKIRQYTPMSGSGWVVFFGAMGVASLLCLVLQSISTSDTHVPLIFFCNRLFSLRMYLKCLNFNLNHSSSGRLLSSNTKNTVWLFYLLSHSNFLLIALP